MRLALRFLRRDWRAGELLVLALAIGMVLGLAAGYFGGRFDAILMRVADIQLSFPSILIAMILLAIEDVTHGKPPAA